MRRALAPLTVLLAATAWSGGRDPSPSAVRRAFERALGGPDWASATWAAEVRSLDTGVTLYARGAGTALEPASTLKLVTTAAALDALGPDARIRTSLETEARVDEFGRLLGDLLLVGRGDPSLGSRKFAATPGDPLDSLAEALAAAGIRSVEGRLVGHEGLFPGERRGADWGWEDLVWGYGAEVSALSYADNCVELTGKPGAGTGDPVRVWAMPESRYYTLEVTATTSPAGSESELVLERDAGSNVIHLSGTLPRGAPAWQGCVAMVDPASWTATLLAERLAARGIVVAGGVVTTSSPAPGATRVLAVHEGPPLSELLGPINKQSLNLQAEMLLRLVGAHAGGEGTVEAGRAAVEAFLDRLGVDHEGWDVRDGSGLSRANLATVHGLAGLLAALDRHPQADVFRRSLALAGTDGTLEHRFRGTLAAGRVTAKTGTLRHVAGLAGYVTTRGGARLAFAVLLDHHVRGSYQAKAAIDTAIRALVSQ